MTSCELLCVGTELLLGDILNTNARFLSCELAGLGFALHRQAVVGDNPARLREDFLAAWERADVVFLTGGLGPTADDVTRETVCGALGLVLEECAGLVETTRSFFRTRGCDMPQTNLRQAMVPKQCTVYRAGAFPDRPAQPSSFWFENPNGTAPGLAILQDGKCAILLPGPPNELEPMFRQSVVPFLAPWADGVIVSHMVRTMGIGESAMAEAVAGLLDGANPSVAPYAKTGESLLRVTARGKGLQEAEALIAPVLAEIQRRLEGFVYGIDVPNLESVLVRALSAQGMTVTTAESMTGGGIAKRLTDCAGASRVLRGSIVAYCDEAKRTLLGVSAKTLEEHTAVSKETAIEMAQGVRACIGTDFALASTGLAGPDDAQLHAYVALNSKAGTQVEHIRFARNDRGLNRLLTENAALFMLWRNIR
ncbi:MAG: CinA family nicotinamide mononucleotide deamidase-related protein [Oscillospiraceae bacterium]|jgi:nicotinamide-nucleotide amidase|nr:CinA family nicotinamide mononucleotide deamidase-related protein [Oscillospiraceae bacterium]